MIVRAVRPAFPVGLVLASMLASPPLAEAAGTVSVHHVANTGDGLYLHPDSPSLGSALTDLMADGTEFEIACWQYGDDVNGDAIWDFGTNASTGHTGFAADFYLDTAVTQGNEAAQLSSQGIPQCGSAPAASNGSSTTNFYDRSAAAAWAVDNWDHKPLIQNGGDCTWFASQSLWAGGLPQSTDWTAYSTDNGVLGGDLEATVKALIHGGYSPTDPINPTINATNANDLINYLVSAGLATKTPINWSDNTADNAQLGDLVAYDWDHGSNGTIDHIAVVTGYASGTHNPTVSQHSANRLNRYWSYDPASHGWIEDAPDYNPQPGSSNAPPIAYLIHIVY